MEEVFEQIGAVSNSWGGLAIQWRELLYICFRNLDHQQHYNWIHYSDDNGVEYCENRQDFAF